MAIPKLKKQDIIDALNYIDEHGIPSQNESAKYKLVTDDGKRYPPKYVIAVADHLANGKEISTAFGPSEAISFLESVGFAVEGKQQEKFELTMSVKVCSYFLKP